MIDNITILKQKNKELIAMLKTLEWSGYNYYGNEIGDIYLCPICNNSREYGHTEDCELNKLLLDL